MLIGKKNNNKDVVIIDRSDKKSNKRVIYLIIGFIVLFIIMIIAISKLISVKKITYTIELKGDKEITIYSGNEYLDPGYIAYDNNKNDSTNKVRIINTVDTNNIGTYEVAYIIGNTIETRKINVIKAKESKTVIHLKGDLIIYHEIGEKYDEPGYIAIDDIDGNITDKVTAKGTIDENKEGKQTITYTVKNSQGVVTSTHRTIIMSKSSLILTPSTNDYTKSDVIINVGIIDNLFSYLILPNGDKVESKTYQYKISENGTYTFTKYNKNGKKAEETITIENIDKKKPTGNCKAYVGDNTKIVINAKDDSGIKYYKFNGNNYYSNNFIVEGKLLDAKVIVYDNAGNGKKISCSIKTQTAKSSQSSSSSSQSKSSSSITSKSSSSSKPKSSSSTTPKSSSSTTPKSSSSTTPKSSSSSKPKSSSSTKPKSSSSSKPQSTSDYDTISNTFSGNKHIADFMAMFEGADKTGYHSGYECNDGKGYIVKDYTTVYTTAYGLTNLSIKDEEHPHGVYPCDTMKEEYKKYFTQKKFVPKKCIPKAAVREALVCKINYDKKYINKRLKECTNGVKFTKQQMAALVDYGNSGIGYLTKVMSAFCNAIESGKTISQAEDAMFKKIFAKKGQGNVNGNCKFIKRRECEAALYFNGNYTCYGQDIYSNNTFTYRFKKYHDSGYNCTK